MTRCEHCRQSLLAYAWVRARMERLGRALNDVSMHHTCTASIADIVQKALAGMEKEMSDGGTADNNR